MITLDEEIENLRRLDIALVYDKKVQEIIKFAIEENEDVTTYYGASFDDVDTQAYYSQRPIATYKFGPDMNVGGATYRAENKTGTWKGYKAAQGLDRSEPVNISYSGNFLASLEAISLNISPSMLVVGTSYTDANERKKQRLLNLYGRFPYFHQIVLLNHYTRYGELMKETVNRIIGGI